MPLRIFMIHRSQNIKINWCLEEVDSNLGNFEGLETSVEELSAAEVVIPRELELEV